jgi:hypothetical protein
MNLLNNIKQFGKFHIQKINNHLDEYQNLNMKYAIMKKIN